MLYNKNFKAFGPIKSNLSYTSGPVYQRGEGIGSFFSNIFKKIIPFASKAVKKIAPTVKKIASSDIVKDTTHQLAKHGMGGTADAIADVIEGKNPSEKAQQRLHEARTDIANVIREKAKPASTQSKPSLKRKKKITYKSNPKRKAPRKNYSVFDDYE